MALIANHPEKNIIRVQLSQNCILKELSQNELAELEPHLDISDHSKGDCLTHQGDRDLEVIFVLDGILKRSVANQHAKEMILRFTSERYYGSDLCFMEVQQSCTIRVITVTKARIARIAMPQWVAFIETHPVLKQRFEMEVMRIMSSIMSHTISLHLLDAPGRVHRFLRKHPDLFDRMPKKELASYLNLSPETLSRLKNREKSDLFYWPFPRSSHNKKRQH